MERIIPTNPSRSILDTIITYYINESLNRIVNNNNAENILYVTELVNCPMKYWLRLKYPILGVQLNFNEKILLGKLIHEGIQAILTDLSIEYDEKVDTEVSVEKVIEGFKLVGRADVVVKDAVIEVKTTRNNEVPYEQHINQVRIYANLLNKDRAILLYVVLSDTIRFYEYEYDPLPDDELHRFVDEVKQAKPAPRYDWECKYCIFRNVCPVRK